MSGWNSCFAVRNMALGVKCRKIPKSMWFFGSYFVSELLCCYCLIVIFVRAIYWWNSDAWISMFLKQETVNIYRNCYKNSKKSGFLECRVSIICMVLSILCKLSKLWTIETYCNNLIGGVIWLHLVSNEIVTDNSIMHEITTPTTQ